MEAWEQQYKAILEEMEKHPVLHDLENDELQPMIWYKKWLVGCACGGDYPYCMYVKKGRSDKLLVFMIGGGLSINEETARGPGTLKRILQGKVGFYTDEVQPGNERWFFRLPENKGILTLEENNCFADWNIAMVNYGTGDFHIGQRDFSYTDENGNPQVLHHRGYANYKACLAHITRWFPNPEKLLIAGESAGAFAVPAIAGDVIAAFPKCTDVTVCSDSALMLSDRWPQIVRETWNAPQHIAEGVQTDNILVDFFRQLVGQIGERARYLFLCGVGDTALTTFQNYFDIGILAYTPEGAAHMGKALTRQVEQLQALGVPFHFYIHDFKQPDGLTQHMTLAASTFLEGQVSGISPMQWLDDAVNGKTYNVGMDLLPR